MANKKPASFPQQSPDEYIESVTLGQLPQNVDIVLAEYSPSWPALYAREAQRIEKALGSQALQLHHVGSTSVPGLCAKPIIDMLLVVPHSADEAAYLPQLLAAGYTLRIREPDWLEHRVIKGPDTDINLHVFSAGCPEIERMLLFRNWLRAHEDDRQLYADTKRTLAKRRWKYLQHYADAKTAVVEEIIRRALAAAK